MDLDQLTLNAVIVPDEIRGLRLLYEGAYITGLVVGWTILGAILGDLLRTPTLALGFLLAGFLNGLLYVALRVVHSWQQG